MADIKESGDMELTVHIGTGKTGSSSIQRTLASDPAALSAQGIAYFGLMFESSAEKKYAWQKSGGWPQLVQQGPQQAKAQLTEVLTGALRLAEGQGLNRTVWSNESIFGNHRLVLPILESIQQMGVHVRIVVYLRRHDAWVRSAYFQWGVKHKAYKGPVKPFLEWYESHKPNFFGGLEPWLTSQWSDLVVRNFDACEDVTTDFLAYMKIDESQLVVTRENETPNAVALALWAIYNSQFEGQVLPVELQGMLRRGGVLGATPRGCDWAALLPSQQDVENVVVDAQADRLRLNDVLALHGQPPIDVAPIKSRDMAVSQDQINAALLMLLKQQGDQIEMLKRRIAQMGDQENKTP